MEATKRTASPVFTQPDGKITRTEDIPPINQLPTDILLIIFGYLSQDPRKLAEGRKVCRRWRRIINEPRAMRTLVPRVGCTTYGIRFSCEKLVNLANSYTQGLPTLDLALVKSINVEDLARLNPGIKNIKVRNCKINTAQLVILVSKMAKSDASLTIDLTKHGQIDLLTIFNELTTNRIQLKKLKIKYYIDENLNSISNAFIRFVNGGGLCEQGCRLSLDTSWFDCEALASLIQKGIQCSALRLDFESINSPESEFHDAFVAGIKSGLLAQVCDFQGAQKIIKVTEALLEKGIQIKRFTSFRHYRHNCLDKEVEWSRALFATVAGPNSSLVCQGIASPCYLFVHAPHFIAVAPHLLASSTRIKTLSVEAIFLQFDRSEFSRTLCNIIESGKLAEGYRIRLQEDMYDDAVLAALTNSSTRMDQFVVNNIGVSSNSDQPRLAITHNAFQRFLLALSQRQSSIDTFALHPQNDQHVFLNQSVVDTLALIGAQGFRFRCFKLDVFNPKTPLNLLPLVNSKALSNCESVELKVTTDNWPQILQGLLDSNIKHLQISIRTSQFEEVNTFFITHRFKCLVDWDIIINPLMSEYQARKNALGIYYFGDI